MACRFRTKLTINSCPIPSLLQRSPKARNTAMGLGRNTYEDVAQTASRRAIWKTMISRMVAFETTRFGENMPRISLQLLLRLEDGPAPAIMPAGRLASPATCGLVAVTASPNYFLTG